MQAELVQAGRLCVDDLPVLIRVLLDIYSRLSPAGYLQPVL
jgi:hypothetical protein